MLTMLVPFLAALACAVPPDRAMPSPERPRYVVDVRVTRPFRSVTGALTVTFTPNRTTSRLVFRLWANGPLQQAEGARLDAGPVTSAGAALPTTRPDPTMLTVRLHRPLERGSSITVHLPWRLRLPSTNQDRIAHFRTGLRLGTFLPLLSWDDRRGWLTDPPVSHTLGETAATPAADFNLRVHVPTGFRVVATGNPLGGGRFRADAVRDVAVAVGRFRVRALVDDGVTLRVASFGVSAARADTALALARAALRALDDRYGAYPWRYYTVVIPPDLPPSGIEYPMLSYVGKSNFAKLLVDHETAHQWFYSLVGNDQARDPWLDETLATWAQTRLGSAEPSPAGTEPSSVRRHVGAPMSFWDHHARWYFYGVYGEGVKALDSLGDNAAVDCAVRAYVARRAYSIAQPGDLLDELNLVIPGAEQRLRAWGIHR
jgi:hypothetical protein